MKQKGRSILSGLVASVACYRLKSVVGFVAAISSPIRTCAHTASHLCRSSHTRLREFIAVTPGAKLSAIQLLCRFTPCDEGWHQSVTGKSKAPAGNRKLLGWSFEQNRRG